MSQFSQSSPPSHSSLLRLFCEGQRREKDRESGGGWGALTGGKTLIPEDLEHYIVLWGPGILILILFAYGFMRLAHHWIDKSMEIKKEQTDSAFDIARDYIGQLAGAHQSQAEALSRLATTVEHRDSLESYEHQEMLIALKAIHRNVLGLVRGEAEGARVAPSKDGEEP